MIEDGRGNLFLDVLDVVVLLLVVVLVMTLR